MFSDKTVVQTNRTHINQDEQKRGDNTSTNVTYPLRDFFSYNVRITYLIALLEEKQALPR